MKWFYLGNLMSVVGVAGFLTIAFSAQEHSLKALIIGAGMFFTAVFVNKFALKKWDNQYK